jgi:N-acetyl-gamma-glutamyl-phosphate reductase/acetylglutamate kinase
MRPDAKRLGIWRRVFFEEILKLVVALGEQGTHPRSSGSIVLVAGFPIKDQFGLLTRVDTGLREATHCAATLMSLAMSPAGQVVNVSTDIVAEELSKVFERLGMVFLDDTA